jgi:adenylate cyclase
MPHSLEEAAKRAGVDASYVSRLVELGIVSPAGGTTFSTGDVRRIGIFRSLESSGIPLDGLAKAIKQGQISFDFIDLPIYERFAALTDNTFEALSRETGVPLDILLVVREATGFARPSPQDVVREDEMRIVPLLKLQIDHGFRPVVVERWLRVYGDSLRRIAETEADWWHTEVEMPLIEKGMNDNEMLEESQQFGMKLEPLAATAFDALYKGQQANNWMKNIIAGVERSLDKAGLHHKLDRPPVMCFLDISGYTRLTEERGDVAAADLAGRLGRLVQRSSHGHGGRAVKWLGDGVMFHFTDAARAVIAALEMVKGVSEQDLPPAHVGLHAGPVVFQEGDYFGRTVNIASRIADYARPHEVLASDAVVQGADDISGIRFSEIGPVELKGVGGAIRLFSAQSV